MNSVLLGIAALACPVGMGLMMWMMMRGQRGQHGDGASTGDSDEQRELAQLRAEIDQLKAERAVRRAGGGQ